MRHVPALLLTLLACTSAAPFAESSPVVSTATVATLPPKPATDSICVAPFSPSSPVQTWGRVAGEACPVVVPCERRVVAGCSATDCACSCQTHDDCHGSALAVAQRYYLGTLPDGVATGCVAGRCVWWAL